MNARVVSFVFDGDTFVGQFSVCAGAQGTLVSVRHKGAEISAEIGLLPEEAVAKTLLGELVRDDLMSVAPKGSPPQPRANPAYQVSARPPRLRRRLRVSERLARATGRDNPPSVSERLR